MTWQPPVASWPDVETVIPAHLRDVLDVDHAGSKRKDSWAGRIVVVRRDGGSVRGVHDVARVAVRCWAPDPAECTDLALLVRSTLLAAPLHVAEVTRVEHLSGPYAVNDASGPQTYQLFEVTLRATLA